MYKAVTLELLTVVEGALDKAMANKNSKGLQGTFVESQLVS